MPPHHPQSTGQLSRKPTGAALPSIYRTTQKSPVPQLVDSYPYLLTLTALVIFKNFFVTLVVQSLSSPNPSFKTMLLLMRVTLKKSSVASTSLK
jgi:hypothetical protein